MMRYSLFVLLLFAVAFTISAQKIVDVYGECKLVVDENTNLTLVEAKRKAIENAIIDAIAREFKVQVNSNEEIHIEDRNGKKRESYIGDSQLNVRGCWLGHTKQPTLDVKYDDGKLYFMAKVWGQARDTEGMKRIDIEWHVLTGDKDNKQETDKFVSGDRVYVDFQSPVDGYVAIYLLDDKNNASCLLPYKKSNNGIFKVKHGEKYIFFDRSLDKMCDIYNLTTQNEVETNCIILLFSPNEFSKANDNSRKDNMPRQLDSEKFEKWRMRIERDDINMRQFTKYVTIYNNNF